MQANRRVFASAIAASGSSNAPGTGITVTSGAGTPSSASSSTARSSIREVNSPLKRATTIATGRRCPPSAEPSITVTPSGTASSPGACSAACSGTPSPTTGSSSPRNGCSSSRSVTPSSSSASSVRSFRSWWCSRWPSFARLAAR